jgi:hypothetical protein
MLLAITRIRRDVARHRALLCRIVCELKYAARRLVRHDAGALLRGELRLLSLARFEQRLRRIDRAATAQNGHQEQQQHGISHSINLRERGNGTRGLSLLPLPVQMRSHLRDLQIFQDIVTKGVTLFAKDNPADVCAGETNLARQHTIAPPISTSIFRLANRCSNRLHATHSGSAQLGIHSATRIDTTHLQKSTYEFQVQHSSRDLPLHSPTARRAQACRNA